MEVLDKQKNKLNLMLIFLNCLSTGSFLDTDLKIIIIFGCLALIAALLASTVKLWRSRPKTAKLSKR